MIFRKEDGGNPLAMRRRRDHKKKSNAAASDYMEVVLVSVPRANQCTIWFGMVDSDILG